MPIQTSSAIEQGASNALPWIIAFVLIAGIGAVAVIMIRSRLIAKSHLRGGEDATVTLLITIPPTTRIPAAATEIPSLLLKNVLSAMI